MNVGIGPVAHQRRQHERVGADREVVAGQHERHVGDGGEQRQRRAERVDGADARPDQHQRHAASATGIAATRRQ